MKLKDLPKIEAFIHKESGRKDLILPLSGNTPVSGKTTTAFGETDPSLVVEKTTGEETYYVMKINNTSGNDAVYNLEIKAVEGTIVKAEVIQYDPEAGMTLDFGNFTGTVSSYSLRGDPIHSSDYEGGEGGCPPLGGTGPGYNGSDDPSPGGGPWVGYGGGQGTDPLTSTSACWVHILDAERPWITIGYHDNCGIYEDIYLPKSKTGDNISADCGDGSGVVIGGGDPITPCEKTKVLVNKPQVKDSLISFKNHAQTNTKKERGFQELKSGTLQQGTVTANNQMFFGIGSNSLGTVHTHQPGTIGILAPQDVMTFLHIVREQDSNALGNAYSGTVSSSGTYFINFTGTASDLPPAMTEAQEAIYVADLVKAYKEWEDLLSEDERYSTNYLKVNKPLGLEILLFKLLKKMNLHDKIQLIKEENGNTSTINENVNGTTTPNPC